MECDLPSAGECSHSPLIHSPTVFDYALIDCADIIFVTIRHYEHNFYLFSEKGTASIICTSAWLVLQQKIVIELSDQCL